MTNAEAAESGTVEDTTAAHEAAVSSQADKDLEAEARDLGWVPEDEFKGTRKPERFKTAREFIDDLPPYVKKLLERQEAKQEAKLAERLDKIERLNSKTLATLTRQHEADIAALKVERREAIKEGDADKVDKLDDKIDKLKADAPDKTDADDPEDIDDAFRKRNAWYGDDDDLTAMAIRESDAMVKAYALKHKTQMPTKEMIDKVEKKIKASPEYKAKFPDETAANGHAAVDGGGSAGPPGKGDPFAKLSGPEKTKAAEDMKAFPKMFPTKQAWLDEYNS